MFPCSHPSREQVPVPWDVRPRHLRSPSPWPSGTEGPVRRALRGSWLPVRARDPGSAVRSSPLPPAAHFLRRRRSGRGIPSPPPRGPLPHSSGPEPLVPCSPGARAGHDLGVQEAELCPSRAGHPLRHRGTPLGSPERWGVGLHPDLGKCLHSAFLSRGPCGFLSVKV